MKSKKEIEEKREEIKSLGYLRKLQIVSVYAIEKCLLNKIPIQLINHSDKIKSISFATATLFSTTILPMIYVYNRDKNEDNECVLGVN